MGSEGKQREVVEQLAEEFVERYRRGERPALSEFIQRHPEHADEIRELFPALVMMEQIAPDSSESSVPPVSRDMGLPRHLERLGDYRILREIGRGGMGVVYEAQQLSLGRHVAIKVLPAHALLDSRQFGRFQREARSAARLHHTNIVPVFGVGEQDGVHYYVMQLIQGLGLDVVLKEVYRLRQSGVKEEPAQAGARPVAGAKCSAAGVARSLLSGGFRQPSVSDVPSTGPVEPPAWGDGSATSSVRAADSSAPIHLPGQSEVSTLSEPGRPYWQSVARIGMQVADALAHASNQGVLHRDIKPANLLLDDTGNVWVTDFGLAKADDSDNLTETGDIVGTLRYMAPERFNGQGDVRSDVYSLGLTLYEMLTLRPAFDETDRNKLVKEVMHGEPVRPRKLNPGVPRDLETVVLKAIARDPAQRYQTPAEMADDLKRFIEDRPVKARRISNAEKLWRMCRRNPVLTAMAAAVVVALTAGTTVSYLKYLDAEWQKGIAQQQHGRALVGEKEAKEQRNRADNEAEVAQQNLYYAQMHLAQQGWREHGGLPHMRELLSNWLPKGESPDRRGWEWFYLNSLPYQNLRTLTQSGSRDNPCTVAWHVASKRLASGTNDGLIRIWDVEREQTTLTLSGPGPAGAWLGIRWLAWSPDGGKLAAGFNDGTVHVWDTRSGRELRIFRGHKSPVRSVAYSTDGTRLASWEANGTIKVWDANTGELTADVAHPAGVTAGAWSPDDTLLASGHLNGTVAISGTHAGDKIVTLRGHVSRIHALAWSPDGTRLASTSFDYTARIWEAASEKMVLGPLRHSHEIMSVAWEPGGNRLATSSMDHSVKIWDATTGREDLTLRGHLDTVYSLSWGPDGRLASGGGDGSVRIWSSIRDQESSVLPGHVVRATSVSWSPDGKRLASGGDDGKVRIWDWATRQEILTLKGHEGPVHPQFGLIRTLAWSPDSTHLASAGLDGTAKVWEAASGREVFALASDRGLVWSVGWSPDGTLLAAGSEDGTIRVVEGLEHTPKVHSFKAHQKQVRALAWSPQGNCLASGGADQLVKLWDPIRGTELARLQGHQYPVKGVAWSPDGKRLASAGSRDRIIIAWEAATGQKLSTMRGHNNWVDAVAWSPDGSRLASAGIDNTVRIWDPRTGEEAFVLRGNLGVFHDVSWHPDGAQLAAASSDGQIWIWDATRGFERDTTARAWPFIDRKVASGSARGEDRLAFAQFACAHKKFAFATRLWAEALEGDPKLFDDRQSQHRYNAARAAVLAAAGQGQEEPPLDEAAKAKLRRQALDWLRAELKAWHQFPDLGPPRVRAGSVRRPSDWKQDSDLTSIRDPAALAKLPASEQKAFAQLWADVDAMDQTIFLLQSTALPLLRTAALQAWLGQDEELADTCHRVLQVARDTKDPTTAERVARICSMRPSDAQTHEAALVLARRAVELGKGQAYLSSFQLTLGMAEYRSGHFAAADEALLAASKLGKNNYHVSVTATFYRAMSLYRQGKEAAAQDLATKAVAKMKPLPTDEKNPLAGNAVAGDLILWMACKEARALLKFRATIPPKVKSDMK